jgi:hypothetical protein
MASEASGQRARQLDAIHDAIQATREVPLRHWVAVAIWEPDRKISVIGEDDLLKLKGYLHSGLWEAAHGEGVVESESSAFSAPDDVREFDKGRMDVVRVGGSTIGRAVFEPGFKWSECIKPIVKTESCMINHVGYVLKGSMMIRMDDGSEWEMKQGDAIHIEPGHDAWTVGDEPCVVLEVRSAGEYALPQG